MRPRPSLRPPLRCAFAPTAALLLGLLLPLLTSLSPAQSPATSTAPSTTSQPSITFCVMGDVPYKDGEEKLLATQLTELPENARFIVHVGDIQRGPKAPVTEDRYILVANILKKSPIPLFILPGDNEWNDAPNHEEAWTFWLRNLHKLDEHWKHSLPVARQKERPENFAFTDSAVLFIGLNLVGGRVHDPAEWKTRHAQNVDWLNSQFTTHQPTVHAAVVLAQANPSKNHADFLEGFIAAAKKFQKPILFIHGDGHSFIHDTPYPAKNITRIQIDMGGTAPPLTITVNPTSPPTLNRRLPPTTTSTKPTPK